jgi:hypothetical protein
LGRCLRAFTFNTDKASENKTFVGGEEHLKRKGIEVVVLDDAECKSLMDEFILKNPAEWCVSHTFFLANISRNEDIGEP